MMAKATKLPEIPPETVAAYLKAVEATPGVEIKEGFGAPYTAINGNMYSMLAKRTGELGIRLSKTDFAETWRNTTNRSLGRGRLHGNMLRSERTASRHESAVGLAGKEPRLCQDAEAEATKEEIAARGARPQGAPRPGRAGGGASPACRGQVRSPAARRPSASRPNRPRPASVGSSPASARSRPRSASSASCR